MSKYTAAGLRQYNRWYAMRDRINNPLNKRYHMYGGRGLTYHEDFEDLNLFAAYVEGLEDCGIVGWSLDREDNNLGYTYGNLRWASPEVQANNRSDTPDKNCVEALEIRVRELNRLGYSQTGIVSVLRYDEGFRFSTATIRRLLLVL